MLYLFPDITLFTAVQRKPYNIEELKTTKITQTRIT